MKKTEYIEKYGTEAYKRWGERKAAWQTANPEKVKANNAAWGVANREKRKAQYAVWAAANPKKVKAHHAEINRKGGKYYEKKLIDQKTGLRGERNRTRTKHEKLYHPIKRIIDPQGLSNIHHVWRTNSSEYAAVGIVEAKGHRHGIINVFSTEDCKYEDVIQLLAGKIALSNEKDIPKFEARMNTTEKRIKMDAIVAEIVKQRLLSDPTLEEWQVRYEVREEVYKNNI